MCGVIRATHTPAAFSISLTGVRSRKQDPTPAAVSHTGVRIRNRCGVVFNSVSICLTGPGRAVWIRRACCGTPFDPTTAATAAAATTTTDDDDDDEDDGDGNGNGNGNGDDDDDGDAAVVAAIAVLLLDGWID